MPNWCWNYLTIKKADADKYVFNKKQEVDFSILVPEPKSKDECEEHYIVKDPIAAAIEINDEKSWFDWYNWSWDKWGVKWNARRTEIHDYVKETGNYTIYFETPWGPPDEWLKVLANKGVEFCLDWEEEGGENGIITNSSTRGECKAWDELVGTLYSQEERNKIEWAIGAIVSGDSKKITKFLVFYGDAGTGKSTILNIIQKLFDGYYATNDPLVVIQHDGDLSKIEDNFLFMATNKPVKIIGTKSSIIRKIIYVHPSGNKFPPKKYNELYSQIDFELDAIKNYCLKVYQSMGPNYYDNLYS